MEIAEQKVVALQDYPALKKLAGVLWRQDASYRGAAVMVGAGFSRCAAQSGDSTRLMPLWMDFSRSMRVRPIRQNIRNTKLDGA
ncbi:hypothetical protein [Pseudomonas putida]|uniref:hypothetical protein n=1 Tax=Pseudomonas putida TaxID=303 RepID=UPI002163BFFF|nr:hypothetical protein [Pseudomonas putida]